MFPIEKTTHLVDVHVGQRVRLARRDLGQSQEALAALCGVTFQQIQKYERGTNRVSASMLWKIGQAQAQPLSYYFDGLPQAPADEHPGDRIIREYAQSVPGRSLLEVAITLPADVLAAHVEAMAVAGEAIRRAGQLPSDLQVRLPDLYETRPA